MTTSSISQNKRHIILVGFRGVGKSSIAELLSKRLCYPFYDSDRDITNITNLSVSDIFKIHKENYFRQIEEYIIEMRCLSLSPIILSTGGGVVISKRNRDIITKSGTVILLTASENTILDRIKRDNKRPPLTDKPIRDEITHLLSLRKPYYSSIKDFEIDTSFISPNDAVERIIHCIQE